MRIEHICIIGAGVSGLVAAKTFLEEGYTVTVFEKKQGLGGVWEKSRTYPGLTTQNPRDLYAFSDYPMPASYPEWPTGEQVRNYLESYAQHFGVVERIQFNAEVTQVEKKTRGTGWFVTVNFKSDRSWEWREQKYEFDFVLVCNGTYSIPKVPNLFGIETFTAFGGKVLHSTEFNDISLLEGKACLVVGFGKSATDIATIAATLAKKCTLVFRQASWKFPRFFLGIVNVKYILLTRFAEAWFPYRYLQGVEWALHTMGKPLVWAFWRTQEMLLRLQFRLDACGMLPDKPINKSVDCASGIAPEGFYKYVRTGKIRAIKTHIARFLPDGVDLANGEQLQVEVVIFGTGFRQDIPFLEEKYRRLVMDERGNFHLYRNLIHPDIPEMGFVGYNSSFFCQLTSEIGARWLVQLVKGDLILPSLSSIHKEMEAEWHWKQTGLPADLVSGTCVAPFHIHHLEQLTHDMDVRSHNQGWKRIATMMMPVDPSAYQSIRQELQSRKQSSSKNAKMLGLTH